MKYIVELIYIVILIFFLVFFFKFLKGTNKVKNRKIIYGEEKFKKIFLYRTIIYIIFIAITVAFLIGDFYNGDLAFGILIILSFGNVGYTVWFNDQVVLDDAIYSRYSSKEYKFSEIEEVKIVPSTNKKYTKFRFFIKGRWFAYLVKKEDLNEFKIIVENRVINRSIILSKNENGEELLRYIRGIEEDVLSKFPNIKSFMLFLKCEDKGLIYLNGKFIKRREKNYICFNKSKNSFEIEIEDNEKSIRNIIASKLLDETNQYVKSLRFNGAFQILDTKTNEIRYVASFLGNVDKVENIRESSKIEIIDLREEITNIDNINKKMLEILNERKNE